MAIKLCYRGIIYTYHSRSTQPAEPKSTAELNQTYQPRQPIYQPKQKALNLMYRGVAYSTGQPPEPVPIQPSHPSEFVTKLSVQLGLF